MEKRLKEEADESVSKQDAILCSRKELVSSYQTA
jgi:hypothetical protein